MLKMTTAGARDPDEDGMTDKFCAFPFKHLVIGPEGTARVCCITNDKVTEHGAPMSLNSHSFDEIWNSAYMRNFRRGMLKGERISACEACYQSEAATGQSYRTTTGVEPIRNHPVGRADVVQFGQSAGFLHTGRHLRGRRRAVEDVRKVGRQYLGHRSGSLAAGCRCLAWQLRPVQI